MCSTERNQRSSCCVPTNLLWIDIFSSQYKVRFFLKRLIVIFSLAKYLYKLYDVKR